MGETGRPHGGTAEGGKKAMYVFAEVCRAIWPFFLYFFYIFGYLDNLTSHIELYLYLITLEPVLVLGPPVVQMPYAWCASCLGKGA